MTESDKKRFVNAYIHASDEIQDMVALLLLPNRPKPIFFRKKWAFLIETDVKTEEKQCE